jgi:IS30 family transposase
MIANTIGNKFPGLKLSTSTIYRMIKGDAPELIKHLPKRGKKRRLRVIDRRGRFQQGAATKRHVEERPLSANERSEIGHLEADSILSRRGSKAAVLRICDRKARKRWYIWLVDLKAETVRKALVKFLYSLPSYARKTLTLDRGAEFAEWDMLEKIFT